MQDSLDCPDWFAVMGAEVPALSESQMLVSPYSEQAGGEWLCSVLGRLFPALLGCQVEVKAQLSLYKSIITLFTVSSLWQGKVMWLHAPECSYSPFSSLRFLVRNPMISQEHSWFCILPTSIKRWDGRRKLFRESCFKALETFGSVENRKYALNTEVNL